MGELHGMWIIFHDAIWNININIVYPKDYTYKGEVYEMDWIWEIYGSANKQPIPGTLRLHNKERKKKNA